MTATNKLNIKNYCNTLYTELEGMKSRLNGFIHQIEDLRGEEAEHVQSHADHLKKIVETIDWKLEVFTKACPLESGSYDRDAIEGASVPLGDVESFPGGYPGRIITYIFDDVPDGDDIIMKRETGTRRFPLFLGLIDVFRSNVSHYGSWKPWDAASQNLLALIRKCTYMLAA